MVIYLIDVVMADFIVSEFRMRGDTTHNTLQSHTNSTKSFTFSFKTSMKAFSHKILQMGV